MNKKQTCRIIKMVAEIKCCEYVRVETRLLNKSDAAFRPKDFLDPPLHSFALCHLLTVQCVTVTVFLNTHFVHIVNWLPEFHLDFPPGIYKPVLVLLWPGSSHIELHNISAVFLLVH